MHSTLLQQTSDEGILHEFCKEFPNVYMPKQYIRCKRQAILRKAREEGSGDGLGDGDRMESKAADLQRRIVYFRNLVMWTDADKGAAKEVYADLIRAKSSNDSVLVVKASRWLEILKPIANPALLVINMLLVGIPTFVYSNHILTCSYFFTNAPILSVVYTALNVPFKPGGLSPQNFLRPHICMVKNE